MYLYVHGTPIYLGMYIWLLCDHRYSTRNGGDGKAGLQTAVLLDLHSQGVLENIGCVYGVLRTDVELFGPAAGLHRASASFGRACAAYGMAGLADLWEQSAEREGILARRFS